MLVKACEVWTLVGQNTIIISERIVHNYILSLINRRELNGHTKRFDDGKMSFQEKKETWCRGKNELPVQISPFMYLICTVARWQHGPDPPAARDAEGPSPRRSDVSKKRRVSAEPRRKDTPWLIPNNPSGSSPMSPRLTTLLQCNYANIIAYGPWGSSNTRVYLCHFRLATAPLDRTCPVFQRSNRAIRQ